MSRTDRTDPYRVHVARYGRERHDHRLSECDFRPEERASERLHELRGYRYRRPCGLEISGRYSYTLSFYPRTRRVRVYRDKDLGAARGAERRASREAVKLHRGSEDSVLGDVEFGDGRTRHAALWNAW